jgi:hypothetical protein
MVMLHRRLAIPRTLCCIIHNLEVHLAMGILDHYNFVGSCLDLDCVLHG